ncbi:MAG: transcription-repair coupling factor, partial [Oscillibacter sp.]|nr:transcription-repair coupling factor [Oscillibacter sp.]
MEAFLKKLQTVPEVRELAQRMDSGGCPAAVTGLQPVQRACVGASAALAAGRPAVFLCGGEREARLLSADLRSLTGEEAALLPEREWELRPDAAASREWERQRLAALYRMASGEAKVVVATPDALMARTLPPSLLLNLSAKLKAGAQADLNALSARLLSAGYARCAEVEGPGQFAVRGGILDVFSP